MSEGVRAFKDALENLNTRKSRSRRILFSLAKPAGQYGILCTDNALIKRVLWFKVHEVSANLRVSLSGTLCERSLIFGKL